MSGASGLRKHGHTSAGDGGTITAGTPATLVATLTNKSGASVAAGDVVVLDPSNDDSFITTTSAASTDKIGIAAATIANNATGAVVIGGYAALVNVNGTPSRGDFLFTSTTAKKADGSGTFGAGAFAVVSTAGATPSAIIFLQTDQGGGGGGGGLSPLYDDGLVSIRFPDDESRTRLAQGELGDGSNAYLDLDFGGAKLVATPDGVTFAQMEAASNGNVLLSPKTNGALNLNTSGTGRVSVTGGNGLVFPSLSSDPASPVAGQVFFKTGGVNKLRCWDGSAWNDLF